MCKNAHTIVKHTWKILQQNMFHHFGILCIKGVTKILTALKLKVMTIGFLNRIFFRVVNENEKMLDFVTILYKGKVTLI